MLGNLLVRYRRPDWRLVVANIVSHLLQSIASLYLPALNANSTDTGAATGDVGYILTLGGVIFVITLGQILCAVIAVYFEPERHWPWAAICVGPYLGGWGNSRSRRSHGSERGVERAPMRTYRLRAALAIPSGPLRLRRPLPTSSDGGSTDY